MKKPIFRGAGVAIITPYTEDGINFEELGRIIDDQIENHTDAIVITGTTGESATMSNEEHKEAIKFAVEHTRGRVPVIAGTGSNETRVAIEFSKYAEEAGADALLVVTPYYNKCTQQGLIRHYGFSFHSTPERLEQLLTDHPDVEFVQLQINYTDWEDTLICSRRCYEIATRHGKPVIVMEPVKGGKLADPPQPVKDILQRAHPDASFASWAIRFVASLPNVMMVLSGMSNMGQMLDNVSVMRHFQPLTDEERRVLETATHTLQQYADIACTACHYCTPGCPMDIHIPEIFAVMNVYKMYGNLTEARNEYSWRPGGEKASACVQCGQCEDACPQHLPIISLLEEVVETLER